MSLKQKKDRKYEPPLVKEIGGVYEQAMGVSQCNAGPFVAEDCPGGGSPQGGCPGGGFDQECIVGGENCPGGNWGG